MFLMYVFVAFLYYISGKQKRFRLKHCLLTPSFVDPIRIIRSRIISYSLVISQKLTEAFVPFLEHCPLCISICLFKAKNWKTSTICKICSNVTVRRQERRQWGRSGNFIVKVNRFHTLYWCFHCWLQTSNIGCVKILLAIEILNKSLR